MTKFFNRNRFVPFGDKILPGDCYSAASDDSTKVYFTPLSNTPGEINDKEMAEKDLVTGKVSKITDFGIERILSYAASRDGEKLFLVRGNLTDEVVLMRNVE